MGFLSILGGIAKSAAQVAAPYVLKKLSSWSLTDDQVLALSQGKVNGGLQQRIQLPDGRAFILRLERETAPELYAEFDRHAEWIKAKKEHKIDKAMQGALATTTIHPFNLEASTEGKQRNSEKVPFGFSGELYYNREGYSDGSF